MVLKLESRTVLRPLIYTRPLASMVCQNICPIVLSRSNLYFEASLQ